MAQVYREIEHPKLPNLKKAGMVIFLYSLIFTAGVAFFAVMIIPDSVRGTYSDNPISGLAMYLVGPLSLRIAFRIFVVVVGVLMLAGAVNTAIVGSNGVLNRVSEDGILPDWFRQPASPLRHLLSHPESRRRASNPHDPSEPRQHLPARRGLRLRRDVELRDEGPGGAGAALQAAGRARIQRAAEFQHRRRRDSRRRGADHPRPVCAVLSSISSPNRSPRFPASPSRLSSSSFSKFPKMSPRARPKPTPSSTNSISRRRPT